MKSVIGEHTGQAHAASMLAFACHPRWAIGPASARFALARTDLAARHLSLVRTQPFAHESGMAIIR